MKTRSVFVTILSFLCVHTHTHLLHSREEATYIAQQPRPSGDLSLPPQSSHRFLATPQTHVQTPQAPILQQPPSFMLQPNAPFFPATPQQQQRQPQQQGAAAAVVPVPGRPPTPDAISAMMKEIKLLSVVAPPGPIGMQLEDGRNGPVVQSVDKTSSLYESLCPGDILVSIDEILTTGMISMHAAGILLAQKEKPRKLTVFPASKEHCLRRYAAVVDPSAMQLKRPLPLQLPVPDGSDSQYMSRQQAMSGQALAQESQGQAAPPVFIKAPESEPHLVATDQRSVDCANSPKYALLQSSVEKMGRLGAPSFKDSIRSFANSSTFCRLLQFEPFGKQFRSVFECDVLFNPSMSCEELQSLINLESTVTTAAEAEGAWPDAPGKKFWFYPFLIALFWATLLWVIIIVCLIIDCVEILMSMSDRRLKADIVRMGVSALGVPIYEFAYASEPGVRWRGTMAQDLLGSRYEAAVARSRDGHYMVDYAMLDTETYRVEGDRGVRQAKDECLLSSFLTSIPPFDRSPI